MAKLIKEIQRPKIESEAEGWLITAAMSLTEFTVQQLEEASTFLRGIKGMKKKIHAFCDPNIKRLNEVKQAAIDDRNALLRPCVDAEDIINDKILKYRTWEREEARKVQADAARAQRAADEAARKTEAQSLRDAGAEQAAEMIEEAPAAPVVAMATAAPTRTEGVYTRKNYKAEVTDKLRLIQFVAENPVFSHLLDVSTKECNKLAKAQKVNMQIPGLKVIMSETVVAKS